MDTHENPTSDSGVATRCQPMRFGRVILARLFGGAVDIAACPNLTDVRAGMSAYRRIPDAAPDGAEGRSLTQTGHWPHAINAATLVQAGRIEKARTTSGFLAAAAQARTSLE